MNFQELFFMGMKRELPNLIHPIGLRINLGSGHSELSGFVNLDLPVWDANVNPIPYANETVRTVFAFHFLEHVEDPIKMLREIERVLEPGGVASIVVPYYNSQMAAHDLYHKSVWCEDTWKNLFGKPYDRGEAPWKLRVHFNLICGVVERNLCLMTQLEKTK